MQLVAYIGLKLKGIKGAVICFIAFGFHAFLIMFILSVMYKHSKNIAGVELVLTGLRVIIIAATFFGYLHFGILGSLLATVCVFIPSFLILMGIIPFFDKLQTYPQFNKVINGILCSFVGFLTVISYRFSIGIHWNLINILIVSVAFALLLRKVDAVWVVLGGILLSIIM
jgi:chromate transport protein ChrA